MSILIMLFIIILDVVSHYISLPKVPPPPPLSRPRYDIFSWAVHIDRPYGALIIFHTGGSVVGVGVEIYITEDAGPGRAAGFSMLWYSILWFSISGNNMLIYVICVIECYIIIYFI